jgi:hypothetical protein
MPRVTIIIITIVATITFTVITIIITIDAGITTSVATFIAPTITFVACSVAAVAKRGLDASAPSLSPHEFWSVGLI